MCPRYLCYNLWDPTSDLNHCTLVWSETAKPLCRPPPDEFKNPLVLQIIHENPDLFKIITPIHVDVFKSYLTAHPNPLFVELVCQGLREDFWPWASTVHPGYPITNDESKPTPVKTRKAEFL